MEQTSAAHAFFQEHKDLFQYETYVGHHDPFQTENINLDEGATKSFLDQYCEIDRDCASLPALSQPRFSLLHPLTRTYPTTNLTVKSTMAAAQPLEFVTLKSTASILETFNNLQHEPIRPHNPLQYLSQAQPPLRVTYESSALPEDPSPDRVSASKPPADRCLSLQQRRSPVRVSVESKQTIFRLPELAELLIDRETRAAASGHKSWDEAHKIEVLVGSKCVGRVSAASRNIPPSICSRLRASANVSVRRERLYDLLRRDYDELSQR